jgi:aryl carrier-like protein
VSAAEIEAHLLTHLLGQNISDLQEKVGTYLSLIKAKKDHPFEPCVSLMLHTYVDESWGKVRDATLKPFKEYLKSSVDLMGTFIKSAGFDLDIRSMTDRDRDDLALFAAEKYMQEGGLFGTREKCRERLAFLGEMGVTEVACLVDFGVDHDRVLESLYRVAEAAREVAAEGRTTARATENVRQDRGMTMMQCTPTLIKTMLSDTAFRQTLGGLRVLLLGGESVPVSLAEEARKCGVQRIMNMYGPTETTVWSTACEMKAEVDRSLIRSPIINTRIHLLDENLQAVPIGATGEIAIGGAGVARGYIGDGAQTAGRFLPDPFSEAAGARLYRTGDLARRDITGALEMLGRSDQQVKIRGYRIELGEIEAALMQIPEIETAVVVPSKAVRASDELSAYVLPKRGTSISTPYVEQMLKGKLPSYMIPSHIEFIHHIPVNANGKIDRVGLLQEPVKVKAIAKAGGKIPSGMEATITAIWKDVLQVSDLSPDDNFFDVGGHSLLMAQVHQRLQEALGREFPLLHLLEAPTIHAMTRMLDTERGEAAVSTSEQAIHQRGALRALWQHAERSREVN